MSEIVDLKLKCPNLLQYGLTLSEREWSDEWRSVLRLASSEPRHSSLSGATTASSTGTTGTNG